MKRMYQFGSTFDNLVECIVDDKEKTIVVTKGNVNSKQEFLTVAKEGFLLALINQVKLHLDGENGCVDPDAYDILSALAAGDLAHADEIAIKAYRKWDDYQLLVKLH